MGDDKDVGVSRIVRVAWRVFARVGDDNDVSVRVAIWFCRAEAPQEGDSLVFVVGVRRGTSHLVYPFHEYLLVAPSIVSPGI